MNLRMLVENYDDFTDEALTRNFISALSSLIKLADANPENIRAWMEDGLLDRALEIEEDDGFGTEGLEF